METKINIAKILRNKPHGVKLYSPIFGDCTYCYVREDTNEIFVKKHNGLIDYFNSEGLYFALGEVMLFPSREMRVWDKFAWKKGDTLSCGVDNLCIFEKWANKEYTEFYAKFVTPNYSGNTFKTEKWSKETNEAVIKQYISNIEEFKGGKLNLTTLEIEKTQPEFKDGDIVIYGKSVAICRKIYKHTLSFYVSLNEMFGLLFADEVESSEEYRFATEAEKQQLFSALENEGKAWDAVKKQIVDLKPKWTPKPFDRVITRTPETPWTANFFSHIDSDGIKNCIDDRYIMCLPYNDETAKLIGTTNNWRG